MKIFTLYSGIFLLFFSTLVLAQEQPAKIIAQPQKKSWRVLLEETGREYPVRFFYHPDSIPDFEVTVPSTPILTEKILREVLGSTPLKISGDGRGNFFIFKDFSFQPYKKEMFFRFPENLSGIKVQTPGEQELQQPNPFLKTYEGLVNEEITIGKGKQPMPNEKVMFRGRIISLEDDSPVPQARLNIREINRNFITNGDGYFEMELVPGEYTLVVNSLGMYEKTIKLTVLAEGETEIGLQTRSILLDETVVLADRKQNVATTTMGFERMTEKAIRELPAVLGEKDVVKMVLLMPGVQSIGEISSGFNVRGSPADQNMFYINHLPVYNSSHLFGLFTTFNSEAISEFRFYKNSIPVEFGGQLSSVFDIDVKRGNIQNFSARGGIGPTSGRVMVEGPLKKEKSSYLLSVRSTYSDWLLRQVDDPDVYNSSASFMDAIADFSFQLNRKDKMGLFFYGSHDYADLAIGVMNEYSNLGAVLKWEHSFHERAGMEFTLSESRYAFEEINREISYLAARHAFDLNHAESKLSFRLQPVDNHKIDAGLDLKHIAIHYGDFEPLSEESSLKTITFEPERAISGSLFLGDTWDITSRLGMEGGIRGTLYVYPGPKTVYRYMNNKPREIDNIVDSRIYKKNEIISRYNNLDYRISAKYELTGDLSLKAGFNRLHQYIFMLSNTVSVSPISKWKLSDNHLKPMRGDQFSAGLYKNFLNDMIETSVEGYYKKVDNLVEYKDGADFVTNRIPETNIIQGDLVSYGVEFMVKKKADRLNGWINYTLSKSEVTVINRQTGELNNQGLAYPANYDRPHAMNLTLNYKLSKRLAVTTNLVYSTGRPVTFPSSVYYLNDIKLTGFSRRNEYRLPDYFRTDLSLTLEGNLKRNKLAHGSWSLSFYNLTGRRNAHSMVFQNVDGEIKGYKISILGTIIPSLNYNLKFGNYEN